MKYRLIYLDIDETLVDARQVIPASTIAALHQARQRGIRIGLATGRMYSSARPYAAALDVDAPLILYNGARVETFKERRVLFQQHLPRAYALRAFALVKKFDIHCNVYVEDQLYVERWTKRAWESMVKDRVYAQPVGDLVAFLTTDPVKLLLIGEGEMLDAFKNVYLEGLADPPHLVRSEPTYLEILSQGVNKGRALEEVCTALDIPLEHVVAFGDSFNDIEMLRKAGLGIAMASSDPAVQREADYVAQPISEEGIAKALWEFVL